MYPALLAAAYFYPQAEIGDALPSLAAHDQTSRPYHFTGPSKLTTIVTVFYTRCPDPTVCANTSGKFAWLQTHLTPAEHIALVEISLDPQSDTVGALQTYAKRYGIKTRRWHLVVTSPAHTDEWEQRIGITTVRLAPNIVRHTEALLILDPRGQIAFRVEGSAWDPQVILESARDISGGTKRSALQTLSGWLSRSVSALCNGAANVPFSVGELMLGALAVALVAYVSLRRWLAGT